MLCKCGNEMKLKSGKFGDFWGCTNFPTCRETKQTNGGANKSRQQRRVEVKRELKKIPNPTPEQLTIFEAVETIVKTGSYMGHKNLVIQATAGSGKTSVLEHLVLLIKRLNSLVSVKYLVFNKRIQEEALEKGLPAQTLHSKLLKDLRNWLRSEKDISAVDINGDKLFDLLIPIMKDMFGEEEYKQYRQAISPTLALVRYFKTYGVNNVGVAEAKDIMFDLVLDTAGFDSEIAMLAVALLIENNKTLNVIDFQDMIYLPYIFNIPIESYNYILIDETQDFSTMMAEMTMRMMDEHSKLIFVGDKYQSIYMFTGAAPNSMDNIIKMTNAFSLPLTVSFRCPKEVARLINDQYPEIPFSVPNTAIRGSLREVDESLYLDELKDGDIVICRTNAPLPQPAFPLISRGIKAIILGRDIGAQFISFIEKFENNDVHSDRTPIAVIMRRAEDWVIEQIQQYLERNKRRSAETLRDKFSTLEALIVGCEYSGDVKRKINTMYSDDTSSGVIFTTTHKIKGGEGKNVYLIHSELNPHPMAQGEDDIQQEYNIDFVRYSRPKETLTFVVNKDFTSGCPVLTTKDFEESMEDFEETKSDDANYVQETFDIEQN